MSYCFIVASSDDRLNILKKCVDCIKQTKYANADVYLYYQGIRLSEFENRDFFKAVIVDKKLRGVFTPRYELMKRYGLLYDFTIIIDDDLFMRPDTNYNLSMNFLDFNERAGCCTILTHRGFRKCNKMKNVSEQMGYYNIDGGMVLPKRSIRIILEYFKDKEKDYSEDMWWLLLYVKGYDLWRDYSSSAIHCCNYKVDGKLTGFSKMRTEKPHVPMLTEWFDSKYGYEERYGTHVYKIKELKDINQNGIRERERNYGKTKN